MKKQADTASTMGKFLKDIVPQQTERQQKFEKLKNLVGKQITLPVDQIETNENIRREIGIEEESFKQLVASISEHGILQNIVTELREIDGDDVFRLVCVEGHRRIAALKQLGVTSVPCFLRSFESKDERHKVALACTIKEDLHPLDRVAVYADWINNGASVEDIARNDKKDPKTIQRYLKILDWPESAKEIVRHNRSAFPTWWLFQNVLQKLLTADQIFKVIQKKVSEYESNPQKKPREKVTLSKQEDALIKRTKTLGCKSVSVKNRGGKRLLEIELNDKVVDALLKAIPELQE